MIYLGLKLTNLLFGVVAIGDVADKCGKRNSAQVNGRREDLHCASGYFQIKNKYLELF
jgi:hypothetical protein